METKDDCIFCQIVSKKLPSNIVFENERIIAFKDINPSAPIHILVIPKEHISSLAEAKDNHKELLGEMQLALRNLTKKLKMGETFKIINNGRKIGQVFHLHYHLLGGLEKLSGDV